MDRASHSPHKVVTVLSRPLSAAASALGPFWPGHHGPCPPAGFAPAVADHRRETPRGGSGLQGFICTHAARAQGPAAPCQPRRVPQWHTWARATACAQSPALRQRRCSCRGGPGIFLSSSTCLRTLSICCSQRGKPVCPPDLSFRGAMSRSRCQGASPQQAPSEEGERWGKEMPGRGTGMRAGVDGEQRR